MNETKSLKEFSKPKVKKMPKSENLEIFFSPRSVAIIGASPKPGNLGGKIVASLIAQDYQGQLTLVNRDREGIASYPAVKTAEEVPMGTELAIAVVPAEQVLRLIEPLASRGVHHLIVVGGGFAEAGKVGEELQQRLKKMAEQYSVRIIGPNCLGAFSAQDQFNSLFSSTDTIQRPKQEPVALISQSGVFLSLALDRLARINIGVHRAVNFGNRIDVGENELLAMFGEDPAVGVIGIYLESFQDGTRFVELARTVAQTKPIVVWKGGHAERGEAAAKAHSSSLAGSYAVFQAACEKAGLIEVQGLEEFLVALQILSTQAPPREKRVLVVSNGGGMGVFLTDFCERYGLQVPKPSPPQHEILKKALPDYFSTENPVDLTGSGTNEQCLMAVKQLMASGEYDCLLLVLLSGTDRINAKVAPLLVEQLKVDKPMIVAAYGEALFNSCQSTFASIKVPVFSSAEAAVTALSILMQRRTILNRVEGRSAVESKPTPCHWAEDWRKSMTGPVDEMQIKSFLKKHGVQVPASRPVIHPEDLDQAADDLGFPLVLKAVAPEILHKTELQGVKLGITSLSELKDQWEAMKKTNQFPIWVEKQWPPGLDLMIGIHRDPQFGPILVFAAGGKYVEVLQEVERLLLPATSKEISQMMERSKMGKIIAGMRGDHALDKSSLISFLQCISEWVIGCPEIRSVDFNPVRLYEGGLVVLDAKTSMRLQKEEPL
jgi:acetyltransferase